MAPGRMRDIKGGSHGGMKELAALKRQRPSPLNIENDPPRRHASDCSSAGRTRRIKKPVVVNVCGAGRVFNTRKTRDAGTLPTGLKNRREETFMKLSGRVLACFALNLLLLPSAAGGQEGTQPRPPGLEKYEAEAADSVEITVDDRVLRLALKALPEKEPDEKAVKALVAGLKGVYVRAFKFDRDGVYQPAEVEALRARFRAPEWSRVVGVRSKRYGDNVDVFLASAGAQLKGLAVVVAAPRELVYVHVSGDIDLERLRDLEGRFRVPRLELYREGKE
jgi:hypothetical protein